LQEKPLPMRVGYTSLINTARKIDGVRVFPTSLLSQNVFPYGELGLMYRDSTHLSYQGLMFFSAPISRLFLLLELTLRKLVVGKNHCPKFSRCMYAPVQFRPAIHIAG
jgi:hypothetical protein